MAGVAAVRKLLAATSMPDHVVDSLLSEASAVWMIGERPDVVAADLVLCHPPLGPDEVRAVVRPIIRTPAWRITVVARDRRGLLAAVAATLAAEGLSITRARAMAWTAEGVAVISLSAALAGRAEGSTPDWESLGNRLKAAAVTGAPPPSVPFQPSPPVRVDVTSQEAGRMLVRVQAPDRVGLLWALAAWLADHGVDIEAVQLGCVETMADDLLLVHGTVDSPALAAHLSGRPQEATTGGAPLRSLVAGARRRFHADRRS